VKWPTHADGSPKTRAELTRAESRYVAQEVVRAMIRTEDRPKVLEALRETARKYGLTAPSSNARIPRLPQQ
jgi:hypothetical protein